MVRTEARWGILLAAAVCYAACGGSSSGGGPTPAGNNPTLDAGSTAPDGGGTGTGGGGGGGGSDGGTGSGADGGTGGGGGSDGGTDPCVGLSPGTPGTAILFKQPLADYRSNSSFCLNGTSDGSGNVDLAEDDGQLGSFDYVLNSTGVLLNSYASLHSDLQGQLSGFEGLGGSAGSFWIAVLGATGTETYRTPSQTGSATYAVDPTGGIVALEKVMTTTQLVAYDAAGHVRWSQPIPESFTLGSLGTDRQGNTLVLLAGTVLYGTANLEGRWFNHAGVAGPTFSAFPAAAGAQYGLFTRVTNGLFLRQTTGGTSTWVAMFEPGATTSQPAPAWLVSRSNSSLHMARGGRAYGVLKAASSGAMSCEQDVEVVAPDGTSCGTAAFTQTQGTCTGADLGVGYDGTVIQSLPMSTDCDGHGHCLCAWQYWPAFLH